MKPMRPGPRPTPGGWGAENSRVYPRTGPTDDRTEVRPALRPHLGRPRSILRQHQGDCVDATDRIERLNSATTGAIMTRL